MVSSPTHRVSIRQLALLFATILGLGLMATPASAAPCCSECDIEEPNELCWYWCLVSCLDEIPVLLIDASLEADKVPACASTEAWSPNSVNETVPPAT